MVKSFGKYKLIKKIAVGGMANLYLAQYVSIEGFKKELVIKKILPKFANNKKFISMFIDEAKVAVNFNHRNIVQIFDFGKINNEYYIAMEFIDGFDLTKLFRLYHFNKRKIEPKAILYILLEILKGLNYAHNNRGNSTGKLVHRDISLNNILVSKYGDVKIVDFGIAKTGDLIISDDLKGKLSYMAPEQLRKEIIDERVDIYALGMLIWRLLTGEKPFDLNKYKTKEDVLKLRVPEVIKINPNIDSDLSDIIQKAVKYDKDERYSSTKKFYDKVYNYVIKNDLLFDHFDFENYIKENELFIIDESTPISEEVTSPEAGKTDLGSLSYFTEHAFNKKLITEEKKTVTLVYGDFKELYTIFNIVKGTVFEHLMEDFYHIVENMVYKYKASILFLDHYGMTFIFGAPISREDDSFRAIKFSLELYDSFKAFVKDFNLPIELTIVINKGAILVNKIFSDMKIKMLPIDDVLKKTRNLAENNNNGVFIVNELKNTIANNFLTKSENNKVSLIIKEIKTSKSVINKFFGLETLFTGREKEFQESIDVLENNNSDTSKNTVFLVGEAGTGKSRFIFELIKRIKLTYSKYYLIKSHSLSYENETPFSIFIDAIKDFLSIKSLKDKTFYEAKIGKYLKAIKDEKKKTEIKLLIGNFIGIDYSENSYLQNLKLDSNLLKSLELTYIKLFFKILSQRKPLILIFEDIHWAADAVLDIIEQSISYYKSLPVHIIIAVRPEIFIRRKAYLEDNPLVKKITLNGLDKENSKKLIVSILKNTNDISENFIEQIYNKSSGVPFFIEEIIKVLIDKKIILTLNDNIKINHEKFKELAIPLSIESILQARIDSLTFEEKLFVQIASVMGREFWIEPLSTIYTSNSEIDLSITLDEILKNLEDKELIFRNSFQNSNIHQRYIFKHALLRDVAYNSIIPNLKKYYHNSLANLLISSTNEELKDIDFVLAYHYENAGNYQKAITFYFKAAKSSMNKSWLDEALIYYKKVLLFFKNIDRPDIKLYVRTALAISKIYRKKGNHKNSKLYLDVAKKYLKASQIFDKNIYFELYLEYFDNYQITGDVAKSFLSINIAKTFVSNDKEYYNLILKESWAYYTKNQLDKARKQLSIIHNKLSNKNNTEYEEELIGVYRVMSAILSEKGNYNKAIEYSKMIIDYNIEKENWHETLLALNNLGETYRESNQIEIAKIYYKRALEINNRYMGNPYIKALLSNNMGALELQNKNYNQALKLLEYSLELLNEMELEGFRYETHQLLAETYLKLNNDEKFRDECDKAEYYSLRAGNKYNLSIVNILRGEDSLRKHDIKNGEFYFLKALSFAIVAKSYLAKMLSYEKLYDLHKQKDSKKAKFYYKKIRELKLEKNL